MKDLFLLILCILHKKKLTLQHCFTYYIVYGTELHLDSILRGGIRHRTRTADFFRQLRCLSGNDGLYIRLVEDSVRDFTRTHGSTLVMARNNEDWREGRRGEHACQGAQSGVLQTVPRHPEGASRHRKYLHEHSCQYARA